MCIVFCIPGNDKNFIVLKYLSKPVKNCSEKLFTIELFKKNRAEFIFILADISTMKNNTLKFFLLSFILVGVTFSLNSCYKSYFETDKYKLSDYEPNLAAPIVHSRLTIGDVLPEEFGSYLNVANDNFVTLVYTSSKSSQRIGELFPIPDQAFTQNIILSSTEAGQINGGSATLNKQGNENILTSGELFSSANLTGGNVTISITSNVPASGSVTITWPLILQNGNPMTQTIPLNYTNTVPVVASATINLAGYTVDLSPNSGDFNALSYSISANLTNGTGASSGQSVQVSSTFNSITYDQISGNFGTRLIDIDPDTTFIQLFSNAALPDIGIFDILQPSLKVSVSHDMLIQSQAEINQLLGYQFNNNVVNFNAPSLTGAPLVLTSSSILGQPSSSSFVADWNNSTIKVLVDQKCPRLVSDIDVRINPNGGAISEALGTSKFKIDKELQLPLRGLAFNFFVQDTADFSFGAIAGNVQKALFRIATVNSFPVDGKIQLYFVDDNYVVLDSLVSNSDSKIITAAPIDDTGKSIGITTKTLDLELDETRFTRLKDSKKILVRAYIASAENGNQNVRIFSDNFIDIKLGMQVILKLGN